MAFPPMYAQQPQGTLLPGQMISVNKYNVQVEKYLSQGGFAHVYLVRTAEPVFGTTHHVLKRIAVPNEAMLNDVKKEVDIMRILKGHPNIVYLIDAAWHRMSNGMFEVFILMEFCQGGGIIDMMNRRLRERLTEAEILQIFVDVCEGVAAMHNLRPPLLHRDLKVENILQASATSFKLCDFGSATPVPQRHPSSMQELRALEADLNKHTTLQYRAPEMVDVYLRRPIDEKSDVWALGVLLYKLCYYTTPFEEHGILAILNVQYKFPPYPVYSQQLNALIASMLREHNVHRPSVFEVLNTVHQMRGTKSRFTYSIPKQPISPRPALSPALSQNASAGSAKSADSVSSPPINGIQAREKVLEAIAPMRRGRPSSPTRGRRFPEDAFNLLDSVESRPWTSKPAKAHKSGLAAISTMKSPPSVRPAEASLGDAWQVPDTVTGKRQATGAVNGFTDAFTARVPSASSSTPSPVPIPAPRPAPVRMPSSLKPPSEDVFESLSLFSSPKPQTLTLGEAQKVASNRPSPSPQLPNQNISISPSPSFQSPSFTAIDNAVLKRGPSPLLTSKVSDQTLSAEQRFPSLEELDAGSFRPAATSGAVSVPSSVLALSLTPPQLPPRPGARQDSSESFYPASVAGALRPGARAAPSTTLRYDGVRSQQVTGTAMRDTRRTHTPSVAPTSSLNRPQPEHLIVRQSRIELEAHEKLQPPSRPMLSRKHRSSVSIQQTHRTGSEPSSPNEPVAGLPVATEPPKDWLTGLSDGEDGAKIDNAAVLRASPEKRASVLVSEGPPDIARAASFREAAPSPVKRKPIPLERSETLRSDSIAKKEKEATALSNHKSGGLEAANRTPLSPKSSSSSDEADDGPEDAVSTIRSSKGSGIAPVRQRFGHKARQGSVHDLVDLWGGSGSPKPSPSSQNRRNSVLPKPRSGVSVERTKSPSPMPVSNKPSTMAESSVGRTSPTKSAFSISRKPSTVSRQKPPSPVKQSPSPRKMQQSPSASSTSRSRPQSVLLFPVQKSVSETPQTPSKASLSPPANKGRTTHRRSSISDLVSRYEAMDEQSKGSKPGLPSVPAPGTKPAHLRVVSSQAHTSSDPAISPTAASARFPHISPTNSPKEPMKSSFPNKLELPVRASAFIDDGPLKHDTNSRPPSRQGSRAPSPLTQSMPSSTAPDPVLLAASKAEVPRTERKPFNSTLDTLLAKDGVETNESGRRSPSPERPYQGVSRLIDQWQRKSEESAGPRGGGNASIRGAGSRFRREGIAAEKAG
ncbi:AKL1 [Sanghuangporus vaninii]